MAQRSTDDASYAVIIPHYNDHDRLGRCLAALVPTVPHTVEVVVVDNQSPVSLKGLSSRFPTVRFVTEPTKGAAAARNRGVLETTAPNLFFLDADCIPDPSWLETAMQVVSPDTVIGGRIDVFDEGDGPRSGAQGFETVFAFDQKAYVEKKGFSVTANLLTTREVFNQVGPLHAGVSEDVDWCHRATQKGFRLLYEDALVVRHPTRSDWPALVRKWRRMTDENFELIRRRPMGRLKWAGRAMLMPVSVLAHLPKVLTAAQLKSPTERSRTAFALMRLRLLRARWMLTQAYRGV